MYINGAWMKTSEEELVVRNPANGEIVGRLPKVARRDMEEAIAAADAAFRTWSTLPAIERSGYLYRVAEKMRARKEEIARTGTLEMGKALADMRAEVQQAIDYMQWFAEEGRRVYGETIPANAGNKRIAVIKQPLGVVGAITPWNFPVSMLARKVAPALAAGCTVIFKPASQSPLTAKLVFEIFEEVGLPFGVANLVVGDAGMISETLLASPIVKKVSFTGSTEVGKRLMGQASQTVTKLSLELGGHAPYIVFEDADLDLAVRGLVANKYRCAGQVCICINRVYVQESIVEEFNKRLVELVGLLKVGDGLDPETSVGPLIDHNAVAKSEQHVQDAVAKGAKVLIGGKRPSRPELAGGSFYEPTVLADATDDMLIAQEETFGPVAPIFTFKTEEEVLRRANHTPFGLSAYFFTNDLSRSHRVAEGLEYGIVGVNDTLPVTVAIPFGGIKESGGGKEGGHQGMDEYMYEKLVSVRIEN